MYDALTSKGVSLAWTVPDCVCATLAREKYVSRGIKYASYDAYRHEADEDGYINPKLALQHHMGLKSDGVSVVSFSRCYDDEALQGQVANALRKHVTGMTWYDEGSTCKYTDTVCIPLTGVPLDAPRDSNRVIETKELQW